MLLGIPATLFVNWLQRTKGRLLAFETRGQNVLTKHGANFVQGPIALTSGGQPIPRLSIAAVTIWNAGDAEIDGAAIATSDPLHIELRGEGEIVQAYVERNPFPGCKLRLLCERNRATVAFDYLNPEQGAVIRILHTAEDPVVDLCGSLMGIQLVHAERLIFRNSAMIVATRVLSMVVLLGAIIWVITQVKSGGVAGWILPSLFLAGPVAITLISALAERRKVIPSQLQPSGSSQERASQGDSSDVR